MWQDPFTPYSTSTSHLSTVTLYMHCDVFLCSLLARSLPAESIKYQDERYSSYSTAMMDNPDYPGSRSATPSMGSSAASRRVHADARALFKERLRQKQRALLAAKEAQWDGSTYKVCPPQLVGIKPWTREPWSRDASIYAQKTGSFEKIFNADQHGTGAEADDEYNDESALDSNNGVSLARHRDGVSEERFPRRPAAATGFVDPPVLPAESKGHPAGHPRAVVRGRKVLQPELDSRYDDGRAGRRRRADLGSISHAHAREASRREWFLHAELGEVGRGTFGVR